jgi:hypothetical protein
VVMALRSNDVEDVEEARISVRRDFSNGGDRTALVIVCMAMGIAFALS